MKPPLPTRHQPLRHPLRMHCPRKREPTKRTCPERNRSLHFCNARKTRETRVGHALDVGALGLLILSPVGPGDGPGEVRDGDDEEAVGAQVSHRTYRRKKKKKPETKGRTHLLDVSKIPAMALYHARKAAMRPKKPPVLMMGGFGELVSSRCR